MSIADGILIGSTIVLAAVAIFGPAYADRFKAWLLRPLIAVEFRLAPPDCHLTDMVLALGTTQKSREPCFIYRLRVTNTGKSQARKCEALIEGLAVGNDNGEFVPYPKYTPVRLVWGAGFDEFVDINPERHFFCDLFMIPSAALQKTHRDLLGAYVDPERSPSFDLGLVLNVKSAFFAQPNRLPPGRYRIDIAIYSENADKVSKKLFVSWSGKWSTLEHEMFRECIVSDQGSLTSA